MKPSILSLALVPLALATFNPAARADNISATLNTGVLTDTLVESSILNGDVFTFTDETIGLLGGDGAVLSSATSVFTATYVDALGTLGVLNVTDVCATVDILGPATPCQAFAFSFTDVTLPIASIVASLDASVNVSADVANLDIASASIAGGSGTFNFGQPPPPPAQTPEPSSLCLMATGLIASAGAVRRRIVASARA